MNVTDLRAGAVFEDTSISSGPWVVLKYEHVKVGRGTANIKVKIRNLKTGTTIEKAFINGARVLEVNLEKKRGQFLYKDGSNLVFMEPVSYEQFEVPQDIVGEAAKFLKEGTEVDLKLYENKALSLVLPLKMKFQITDTDPGYKGNSVTNIYKDATIETGAKIRVPMFVTQGEFVLVNTDTGEYVERAK